MKKINIAFDISQTGKNKAGCGFFAHQMISALLASESPDFNYQLLPHYGNFFYDAFMPSLNPYTQGTYGPRLYSFEKSKNYWQSTDVEKKLNYPDIIHANNFWCPIQLTQTKLVYTLYDIGFIENPEWTTEANRLGCFEGVFKASMHADYIISISEFSKKRYLETFPHFPEDRIEIIYPSSRFEDKQIINKRPARFEDLASKGFWLCVGTIEPRKNQKFLAEAYANYLEAGGKPMPMVFAGQKGWKMEDFESHLEQLDISKNVLLTGYVSDEELLWLYQNCYANLYPSFYEGFGLPVLEGMQFGAATISSTNTSMVEIIGEDGILLNPDDVRGWRDMLLKVSLDKNIVKDYSAKAKKRACSFIHSHSITKLENIYRKVESSDKRA